MSLRGQDVIVLEDAYENERKRRELGPEVGGNTTDGVILRVLDSMRENLDMDVVLVSEFTGSQAICRCAVGRADGLVIRRGDIISSSELDIYTTALLSDSCFLEVPINFSDGRLYGTLCSLSRSKMPARHRDVRFMRVAADLIAERLETQRARAGDLTAARMRILQVLEGRHEFAVVFQPIVDLRNGRVVGYEALARFMFPPYRTPEQWFEEAWSVDLGDQLEFAAVRRAIEHSVEIPDDAYISINVSPAVVASPFLEDAIPDVVAERVVLELTEHMRVDDYAGLSEALRRLRRRGIRLAIDDTGAGFASLRHVLRLAPEIIKLDLSLTRGIDCDPRRWALAESLLMFSHNVGAAVVAEGIEERSDLATLKLIGFPYGQGRALHRPSSPPLPSEIAIE